MTIVLNLRSRPSALVAAKLDIDAAVGEEGSEAIIKGLELLCVASDILLPLASLAASHLASKHFSVGKHKEVRNPELDFVEFDGVMDGVAEVVAEEEEEDELVVVEEEGGAAGVAAMRGVLRETEGRATEVAESTGGGLLRVAAATSEAKNGQRVVISAATLF